MADPVSAPKKIGAGKPQRTQPGIAPAQDTSASPPAISPGFVDARPQSQVSAHPVPGYDYSRVGVGGAPPAGGVGVTNAYAPQPMNLPEQFKRYPASQKFDIPADWGQAVVESNGTRMYSYTTPQERQANDQRHQEYLHQQRETQQAQTMNGLNREMGALIRGTGPNGALPAEQRAAMAQVTGQQIQAMMANQSQNDATRMQLANDPRNNPRLVDAQIAEMQAQTQRHLADAAASDPLRKLDLIDAINRDPQRRSLALAMGGADAQTIAAMPPVVTPAGDGAPAVNPGNLMQHLSQPANAGMAKLFEESAANGTDLGETIARAATMPGFADPMSENRQLFDAWLKQTYTNPAEWQKQLYVPPDPDRSIPVLGRIPGLVSALYGSFAGPQSMPGTGTGLGWRGNYDDARRRFDLIQKYGISPF
jgi:hypothetical protein